MWSCLFLAIASLNSQATAHFGVPSQYLRPAPLATKTVMKVNGRAVTSADLEPFLWDWFSTEAGQELASYEVIRQEAEKRKIQVAEREVQAAFDEQISRIKQSMKPGVSLDQALREQGFSPSRLYLRVKTQVLLEKLGEADFNKSDYVKVSTIIFRPKSEEASEWQSAAQLAEEAYIKLQGGLTWKQAVETYSSDPKVVKTEGMIGWKKLSAFPTSTMAALRAMKPGDITKPTQTGSGFQIFRLELSGERAETKDLADLKAAYRSSNEQTILARLHKEAKIEFTWP